MSPRFRSALAAFVIAFGAIASVGMLTARTASAASAVWQWTSTAVGVGLNPGGQGYQWPIDCVSPAFCATGGAVGDAQGNLVALLSTFDGTTWHDQTLAQGASFHDSQVNSISCVTATFCVAGGFYTAANNARHPFAAVWNGTVWQTEAIASSIDTFSGSFRSQNAGVWSVSCSSVQFCALVGGVATSGDPAAFAVTFDGTSFSTGVLISGITGFASYLSAVSCPIDGTCTAMGLSESVSPTTNYTYTLDYIAGVWSSAVNVVPSNPAQNNVYWGYTGIDCVSASWCGAEGPVWDGSLNQTSTPFFAGGTQGTWYVDSHFSGIPSLDGESWNVSCAASGSCALTGSATFAGANTRTQAYVATISNGTWTYAKVAPSAATAQSYAFGISCPTISMCAASGKYTDTAGHDQAFISMGAGTSWTSTEVATDLNVGGIQQMGQISCPTAEFCVANGSYRDAAGNAQPFVVVGRYGVPEPSTTSPENALPATGLSLALPIGVGFAAIAFGGMLAFRSRRRAA